MRETIYHFLFVDGRRSDSAVICTWPSHLPTPFTSNILEVSQQDLYSISFGRVRTLNRSRFLVASKRINLNIFTVNKQVSDEASHYFLSKLRFRFNSAQIPLLLITPNIFHRLRYLEIEDVECCQRRWNLIEMIDRFAECPNLRQVLLGTNMIEYKEGLDVLFEHIRRPFSRWYAEKHAAWNEWYSLMKERDRLREDYDQMPYGGSVHLAWQSYISKRDECAKSKARLVAIDERRPGYGDINLEEYQRVFRGEVEVEQDEPVAWELKLDEIPKVSFANFRNRLKYERMMAMLAEQEEASRLAAERQAALDIAQNAGPFPIPGSFTNAAVPVTPTNNANPLVPQRHCIVM